MKHWLITLSFLLLAFCAGCGTKNKVDLPDQPIVILFENDVHCAVDGYAKLVSLREKQRERTPYVAAVSCGVDCVTLLLPLWRKAQVHARIRDED